MTTTRKNTPRRDSLHQVNVDKHGNHQYETYKLGKELGKGGFATVYELTKRNQNVKRAVKIISLNNKQGQYQQKNVQKANNQISILQQACKKTDKVVQYVHHFTSTNKEVCIIMEHCELGDLNSILKRRKQYSEPQVRFYAAQIVSILAVFKEKNIVHRDIKLANIFISEGFKLKAGDFGLAIRKSQLLHSRKSSVCGTPNYLAPEAVQKRDYGFEVDLWALGVMMFTMLAGEAPFEDKTCKQTYQRIKKCEYRFRSKFKVSDEGKSLINRIFKKNPKERIKLDKILEHPFFTNYSMPQTLEKDFVSIAPSKEWVSKYMKKIDEGKIEESTKNTTSGSKTRIDKTDRSKSSGPTCRPEKPITTSRYRNIRKKSESKQKSKSRDKKPKLPHKVKILVKREQETDNIMNRSMSKLETSASLKRKPTQEYQQTETKKKFRFNNGDKLDQLKEQQVDASTQKYPTHHERTKVLKMIYTDHNAENNALQAAKNFTKKMEQQSWLKLHYDSLQQPKFDPKSNFILKKKIVWFQRSPLNELIYQLNTGQIGSYFRDGTIMLSSSSKIMKLSPTPFNSQNWQYLFPSKYQKIDQNYSTFTYYCKQLQVINLEQNNDRNQYKIYVDSFAFGKTINIFHFNNGDRQYLFNDGFCLMFHAKEYYVSCEDGENVGFYPLPMKPEHIHSQSVRNKWEQAVKAHEEIKILGFGHPLATPTSPQLMHTTPCREGVLSPIRQLISTNESRLM